MENLNNVLSIETLKTIVPSAFSTSGSPNVSSKYVHISSSQVIEDMMQLGWEVNKATQTKARKKVGFQKHMIVFRNPNIKITSEDNDIVFPQIVMTNSSDATSCFQFHLGLFRLVCENGLVVASKTFNKMSIRHMGYSFETLKSLITQAVEALPLTVDSMNKMKEITLTQIEIEEFVSKALDIRFTPEKAKNIVIDTNELLTPVRNEDMGKDIWSIFNVIQEKLVTGNLNYFNGIKSRKVRPIKNFNQDLQFNSELFELALAYTN
jgi:hypothetical protein